MDPLVPLDSALLPSGIRSRFVDNVNGLRVHLLEAGRPGQPCVLLLHGFPEIAYSWRKVMPALAEAGHYVVAPDLRGYGRTTGWDPAYDTDLTPFRLTNVVLDAFALVCALGYDQVALVAGHDFGAPVAALCALIRPDMFRRVAIMSAPFEGLPHRPAPPARGNPQEVLADLDPPRKHYWWYYSTRPADWDMRRAPQGVHDFLRAYFHMKSADWSANRPFRLASWSGDELAKMPHYYIMPRDATMPEAVAPEMPSAAAIAACRWLPDDELAVYTTEWQRNGFQGGLQHYRCRTGGVNTDLMLFAGRTIDVPSIFIAGTSDWGVYQGPGSFEAMQERACTRFLGAHLLDGAGHWVQQEQPERVTELLLELLGRA